MSSYGIGGVIVRLEVDHMKESILHFFAEHSIDLQAQLQDRLDEAVKKFNWDAAVETAFDQCLQEVIRRSISAAVQKSFGSDEVVTTLEEIARRAIFKYTNRI